MTSQIPQITTPPAPDEAEKADEVESMSEDIAGSFASGLKTSLFLLEKLGQGLCVFDRTHRLALFNRRYAEMYDLSPGTLAIGMQLRDIIDLRFAAGTGPDMTREDYARWRDEVAVENKISDTVVHLRNGRIIRVHHEPTPDGGWVSTHDDITEHKQVELALHEKATLLDATLESMDQGLMMIDAEDIVRVCNQRAIDLLDLPPEMMRQQPKFSKVLRYQQEQNEFVKSDKALLDLVADGGLDVRAHTYERRRPNGTVLEIRTVPLAGGGAVRTYTDITERKEAEGQIAHMARHDALTDLPNRTLFHERLDQELSKIARHHGTCAVLCLDLDQFKSVNDTFGHLAGDALLREIGHRFRSHLRAEDTVARLGGDEFAILLGNPSSPDQVAALAARLIASASLPVIVNGHEMCVGLSIGIAFAPADGANAEDVFKHADLALYRAKTEGRNAYRFFEAAMYVAATQRIALERDLRLAISEGELQLHFQPQVHTLTGELVGFEALVRWVHPSRGMVPPSIFIPLAEESGLIIPIGEWVLRAACREAARWTLPLKVAVNLSPRQFQQADLPNTVLQILSETGLSPSRLELEITETLIINDMARALLVLRRLKDLGITIAMDDFGTGYSSLATLQAFPFDKIKIDRSFVGQMSESPEAAVIVRAVLGLGRSLGMGVVAEGVETSEQMVFLSDAACDEVQGFYIGKPEPIECFADRVHAKQVNPLKGTISRLNCAGRVPTDVISDASHTG